MQLLEKLVTLIFIGCRSMAVRKLRIHIEAVSQLRCSHRVVSRDMNIVKAEIAPAKFVARFAVLLLITAIATLGCKKEQPPAGSDVQILDASKIRPAFAAAPRESRAGGMTVPSHSCSARRLRAPDSSRSSPRPANIPASHYREACSWQSFALIGIDQSSNFSSVTDSTSSA